MKIDSRATVDRFLEHEEEMWKKMSKDEKRKQDSLLYCGNGSVEVSENTVLPVVGCWLVPADAFGVLPEGKWEDIEWERKMVVDLSKHRPQLAVLDIPL